MMIMTGVITEIVSGTAIVTVTETVIGTSPFYCQVPCLLQ